MTSAVTDDGTESQAPWVTRPSFQADFAVFSRIDFSPRLRLVCGAAG
jgi:hypothetical protein